MSFRRFFALLFALAMIIAPLAMPVGAAMAAPVESHHDDAAMSDHCDDTSDQGKPDKAAGDGCCVAMCVGIAIAPASADEPPLFAAMAVRPAPDRFRRGFLGEIATPPPRLA